MTFSQLLDYIDLYIDTNGTNNITGAIDNDVRHTLANYFEDNIGKLSNLSTSNKSNLVSAINEVLSSTSAVESITGLLSNLNTTNKTNLVAAINELVSTKKANFSENTAFNKNYGTSANEVRMGDHTHFSYSVTTDPNISLTSDEKLQSNIAIAVDTYIISSITGGVEGQQLTLFAPSQLVDLTACPDIQVNVQEIGVGPYGEWGSITMIYADGLWRQISYVNYPLI